MQDYITDIIIEIGKDILSENTEKNIKAAINNSIENGIQGEDLDFEKLFKTVMKSTLRTLLADVCGEVVALDIKREELCVTTFYKLIMGDDCLKSTNYDKLNINCNESIKKIYKTYDYASAVLNVVTALEEVKSAEDEAYYNAVRKLSSSFLGLANIVAGSVPVIGDVIKNMISVAKGGFEYQYNYILNDLKSNNTAMAKLALNEDIEEAALYLLAQENLVFDEEAIITLLLDRKGININSSFLAVYALACETHEDFIRLLCKSLWDI